MCGIAGVQFRDPDRRDAAAIVRAMCRTMVHRGPDHEGVHGARALAFGMRRLDVIDPEGGDQPIFSEDGSRGVVFNGEIYDFGALGRELSALGHAFRSRSDTEVIVHGFEEWGDAVFERLDGMYAIAALDARDRSLTLARDRLGIKPLYVAETRDGVVFASELKAILASGLVAPEVDAGGLDAYLTFGFVPRPCEIVRGVERVPPGGRLVLRGGRVVRRARIAPFRPVGPPAGDPAPELRERLRAAVKRQLVADVPVGFFLSGGVDSAAVVALAREAGAREVKTFTIGFEDPRFDESADARAIAERFETTHREFRLEPSSAAELERLAWFLDEPFADPAALPTYFLARLARAEATVALSGDGGDEMFAGYDVYRGHGPTEAYRRLVPGFVRRGAMLPLARAFARFHGGARKLVKRLRDAEHPADRRLVRKASLGLAARLGREERGEPFLDALAEGGGTFLERLSRLHRSVTLPDDMLHKADRATMAHSLELRVPLLDPLVADFAAALPLGAHLRGGRTKAILKDAIADLVPPSHLAKRKRGFDVPLEAWFRSDLVDFTGDVLRDRRARDRGLFVKGAVDAILDDHRRGRADLSRAVHALVMLELWMRSFTDAPRRLEAPPVRPLGALA